MRIGITETQLAGTLKYLTQSRIVPYKLGNEPDLYYPYPGFRGPGWGVLAYGTQMLDWLQRLRASAGNVGLMFQFGSIAQTPSYLGDFTQVQLAKMRVP